MWIGGNRYLTDEEMKINAQYIYDYLSAKGWTKNAVAAMLGNMETESTINPAIWEGLEEGNLSKGFGLVQWTPATKYLDWCTTNNLEPTAIDSNIGRILYEVENNIQWGNDTSGNPPPYSFKEFTISTDTPENLAFEFLNHYERPLVQVQPARVEQARKWFDFLKGKSRKSKVFMYIGKRRIIIQ